ncbi:MAG: hypothetical protein K6G82_06685 [Ruminococcus sp.]|nr:hypothetical protein [Ruminococcus sp.]
MARRKKKMAMMKMWNDPPGARFRIRNAQTGTYIHATLFRVLEFRDRLDALAYIKRHDLNPMIYYVEVVR